jgi:membrane fusion protein (multidrug efflux system)
MKPGQKATLVSDFYGSKVTYHGTVEGVSAGSGSAFALLPAQNASGNWIKVIQRVPVRIRLDPEELRTHPLRVGLSMTVKVDLSAPSGQRAPAKEAKEAKEADIPVWQTPVYDHDRAEVDTLIDRIIQENLAS